MNKKSALLAQKKKLIQEIKYYEKRIEDAKYHELNNNFDYDESSDSDFELFIPPDRGTTLANLTSQKEALLLCTEATKELTGLQIIESEVNILTEDPVLDGEPPVTEEGKWQEVIAECSVDLVAFTISFCVHKPYRQFGAPSYRCLRVVASKEARQKELSKSILNNVTTPSDAFEVLKSYAMEHRSRRSTLASLAETYGGDVHMVPLPEGGFQLSCADLLKLSWTLKSRNSTVASFHHWMQLSLEYMDKSYVKIINQANKELSNPSLSTDERTLLLSKIISTCFDAKKNMHTGSDTSKGQKRSHDNLGLQGSVAKKKKDNEVMAPPQSLPKKSKHKDVENKVESRVSNKIIKKVNDGVVKGADKGEKNISDKNQNVSKVNKKVPNSNKKNDNNTDKNKAQNINKLPSKTNRKNDIAQSQKVDKINKIPESQNENEKVTNTASNVKTQNVKKVNKIPSNGAASAKNNENNAKSTDNVKTQNVNKVNKIPSNGSASTKGNEKNTGGDKTQNVEKVNKIPSKLPVSYKANGKNPNYSKEPKVTNMANAASSKSNGNEVNSKHTSHNETVDNLNKEKEKNNKIVDKGKDIKVKQIKSGKENAASAKNNIVTKANKVSTDNAEVINGQNKLSHGNKEIFPLFNRLKSKPRGVARPKNSKNTTENSTNSTNEVMTELKRSDHTQGQSQRHSNFELIKNRIINNRNINKGNINLQKSPNVGKIMKNIPSRVSPRISVTKFSTMTSQRVARGALGDVRSSSNIAKLVKKPPEKRKQ